MNAPHNGLIIRPAAGPQDLTLFTRLPYDLNDELPGDLRDGRRQPGWLWMALRQDGHLMARTAWWTRQGSTAPAVLDILDIDDAAGPAAVEAGTALLRTAMAELFPRGPVPPYLRFVEPDWRDDPQGRLAVDNRMRVAANTGARFFVERLRLRWQPGTPIAPRTGRLNFRPAEDTGELLALMTEVLDGTLDAHSRADLTRMPPQQVAAEHLHGEFDKYKSPRAWWQIATLPSGEPVGFVIPAHNGYSAIIAYLGVVPAHRGNGYIAEILAEGTRILAAELAPEIRASTDLGNVPMANAFHRAGWITAQRQIDMVWDS